jgi:acetyl esterase/lipase
MIRYEMRNLLAAASFVSLLTAPALLAQPNKISPTAQSMILDTTTIPLWEGRAPGAVGDEDRDRPTLTIYMPRNAPAGGATAVVVCPGGGYGALAMNHEGREVANYLNALGIAAFVLKYRLGPRYHHPIELGDAQRAVRIVRARAAEWRVAPERIGIVGFSAGGHLASTISTHFDAGKSDASDPIDRMSCRPEFAVLGYPVISMTAPWTHQGSKRNLLGENASQELAQSLSGELQVTAQTPPTFIFHTNADTGVPAENSIYYFLALRKAGVPAEMHIFQKGPHGVGLGMNDFALGEWPRLMANWLRVNGFLK